MDNARSSQCANAVRTVAVLTLIAAAGLSCGFFSSERPTRNYYIINYTPTSTTPATSKRPYPITIQIGQFEVQRIFNRLNIIYRFSPNQIQYYDIENWAVRPDEMIRDVVYKHMDTVGLVNRVAIDFFDFKPDYRLDGTVEAVEKLDAGDLFFAHLAMSFSLVRVEDGEQVWNYSFDQRRQVYSPEMVYTVRTLSSIVQTELDVVVNQLDSYLLGITTGTHPVIMPSAQKPQTAGPDSAASGLDESSFEIIPEKPR